MLRPKTIVFIIILLAIALSGCGSSSGVTGNDESGYTEDGQSITEEADDENYINEIDSNIIIRARATVNLSSYMGDEDVQADTSEMAKDAGAGSTGSGGGGAVLSVRNQLDVPQRIRNREHVRGHLVVSDIFENDLSVCDGGCAHAYVVIYTWGDGEGFYNSDEDQSIPIFVDGMELLKGSRHALIVGETSLGEEADTVELENFGGEFEIPVEIDFSDARQGTYSTMLIIDYILQKR